MSTRWYLTFNWCNLAQQNVSECKNDYLDFFGTLLISEVPLSFNYFVQTVCCDGCQSQPCGNVWFHFLRHCDSHSTF